MLRELAGGWTLASHPDAEESARRLLARPRTPGLTPAQAETLSIVGYLQPVSRPEVARIRGVASESATTSLVERGLIEEAGRSQFGAILYRTTPLFLKLFGLKSIDDLPDPAQWDPEPGGAGRAARPPAARRRGARRHAGVRLVTARSRAPRRGHAILRRPFRDSGQGRSMFQTTHARGSDRDAGAARAGHRRRPSAEAAREEDVRHPRRGRGAARAHRLRAGNRLGHRGPRVRRRHGVGRRPLQPGRRPVRGRAAVHVRRRARAAPTRPPSRDRRRRPREVPARRARGARLAAQAAPRGPRRRRRALRADPLRPRPARDPRPLREQRHRRPAARLPHDRDRRRRQHHDRVHDDLVQRGRRDQHPGADGALGADDRHRVDLPRRARPGRADRHRAVPGAEPRDEDVQRRQGGAAPAARQRHREQQPRAGHRPGRVDRLPVLPLRDGDAARPRGRARR